MKLSYGAKFTWSNGDWWYILECFPLQRKGWIQQSPYEAIQSPQLLNWKSTPWFPAKTWKNFVTKFEPWKSFPSDWIKYEVATCFIRCAPCEEYQKDGKNTANDVDENGAGGLGSWVNKGFLAPEVLYKQLGNCANLIWNIFTQNLGFHGKLPGRPFTTWFNALFSRCPTKFFLRLHDILWIGKISI